MREKEREEERENRTGRIIRDRGIMREIQRNRERRKEERRQNNWKKWSKNLRFAENDNRVW